MVLQQPPARGLRRVIGQTLISVCTVLVGYGSWAAQSDSGPTGAAARVTQADSEIRISSDTVQASEHGVRYTGNVILEMVHHDGHVQVGAKTISFLGGPFKGDVKLEGNVKIEVDGRIFTTEHAFISETPLQKAFLMDEVEVPQEVTSEAIPAQ